MLHIKIDKPLENHIFCQSYEMRLITVLHIRHKLDIFTLKTLFQIGLEKSLNPVRSERQPKNRLPAQYQSKLKIYTIYWTFRWGCVPQKQF